MNPIFSVKEEIVTNFSTGYQTETAASTDPKLAEIQQRFYKVLEDANLLDEIGVYVQKEHDRNNYAALKRLSDEYLFHLRCFVSKELHHIQSLDRKSRISSISSLGKFINSIKDEWFYLDVYQIIQGYYKGIEAAIYFSSAVVKGAERECGAEILETLIKGGGFRYVRDNPHLNIFKGIFLQKPQKCDLKQQEAALQFVATLGIILETAPLFNLAEVCIAANEIFRSLDSLSNVMEMDEKEYYRILLSVGHNAMKISSKFMTFDLGLKEAMQPMLNHLGFVANQALSRFDQEPWRDLCYFICLFSNAITLGNIETPSQFGKEIRDLESVLTQWDQEVETEPQTVLTQFEERLCSMQRRCDNNAVATKPAALYEYLLEFLEQNYKIVFEERDINVFPPIAWIMAADIIGRGVYSEIAELTSLENVIIGGKQILKVQSFFFRKQEEIFSALKEDYLNKLKKVYAFHEKVLVANTVIIKEAQFLFYREAWEALEKKRHQKRFKEVYESYEKELCALSTIDFRIDYTKPISELLVEMRSLPITDGLMVSSENRLALRLHNNPIKYVEIEKLAMYLNIGRPLIRYKVRNPQSKKSLTQPWGQPLLKFEIEVLFQFQNGESYLVGSYACEGKCNDPRILQAAFKQELHSDFGDDLILLNGWQQHTDFQIKEFSPEQVKMLERQRRSLKVLVTRELAELPNHSMLKYAGSSYKEFNGALDELEKVRGILRNYSVIVGASDSVLKSLDRLPGKRSIISRLVLQNKLEKVVTQGVEYTLRTVESVRTFDPIIYQVHQQILGLRLCQMQISMSALTIAERNASIQRLMTKSLQEERQIEKTKNEIGFLLADQEEYVDYFTKEPKVDSPPRTISPTASVKSERTLIGSLLQTPKGARKGPFE